MKDDQSNDTKLRRAACKQGHALKRDRKDGAYYIIDPNLNTIEAGLPHGMTADEVGTWCGHKVVEK